jgi:transposase
VKNRLPLSKFWQNKVISSWPPTSRIHWASGRVCAEGFIPGTRFHRDQWMKSLPQPWTAAMEATVFTGWIYDHLQPHAAGLKVAHPLMLRAIAAAKKKNDRIGAQY